MVLFHKLGGFVLLIVGGVEVRGFGRKLGGAGVYHLEAGRAVEVLTTLAGELFDGGIQESVLFGGQVFLLSQFPFREALLHLGQLLQLGEEPLVNHGDAVDLIQGDAPLDGLVHHKNPLVVAVVEQPMDFLIGVGSQLGHGEGVQLQLNGADRLHHGLLEIDADGHHLAGGLHLGAQGALAVDKFIKGPFGEFDHQIVDSGFKAGVGGAGHRIENLVQGVADGNFGGNLGDGIASGFGSQSRGTGNPGVYLDDRILKGGGVQGKLAVASAFHPQGPHNVEGGGAEHLKLFVREGHRRGHNDGIAGVDAHRVHILHGADGDAVALAIPDDLKLDLLPAGDALLHQNLGDGGKPQAVLGDLVELLHGVGDAAAGAAHGECRPDDDRQADLPNEVDAVLEVFHHFGGDAGLADLLHGVFEHLAVLRLVDGLPVGAQQLDVVGGQEALLIQLHGEGQTGLSAQGGKEAVRLFDLDDPLDGVDGQGLDVDVVGHGFIGHDGGGVRVDKHNLQPFFFQGSASLGARVVKLRGLADDDGAGADHQDFFDIAS